MRPYASLLLSKRQQRRRSDNPQAARQVQWELCCGRMASCPRLSLNPTPIRTLCTPRFSMTPARWFLLPACYTCPSSPFLQCTTPLLARTLCRSKGVEVAREILSVSDPLRPQYSR
ncbi:hypothetical protein BD626DRAFT_630356 [Schizophyllum amplum]|uniref:Uncharacterized protein n=1 Tax=Schizophyllum amplum TaxID=97359 RepID=A0A550CEY6_9AGAR|nr:hypothetical protein BD626DRAFT_630356 [Auriculariopsis ampla]